MNKVIYSLTLALFVFLMGCQKTTHSVPKFQGHELVYYYRTTCPYSQQVSEFIKANHIPVVWRDIQNDKYAQQLVKVGGRKRVPCLVIDGKPLYGSNAILDWLKEHLQKHT